MPTVADIQRTPENKWVVKIDNVFVCEKESAADALQAVNDLLINNFVSDRDDALLSLDEEKIRSFMMKYKIGEPKNDLEFWAGVHKAIVNIKSATDEQKERSRCWLVEHGFESDIVL